MASFKYENRLDSGDIISGTVVAPTLDEAMRLARQEGGFVLNVLPLSGGEDIMARLRSTSSLFLLCGTGAGIGLIGAETGLMGAGTGLIELPGLQQSSFPGGYVNTLTSLLLLSLYSLINLFLSTSTITVTSPSINNSSTIQLLIPPGSLNCS